MKTIFKKMDSKVRKFRSPIATEETRSVAFSDRRQFDAVAYGAALEVLG